MLSAMDMTLTISRITPTTSAWGTTSEGFTTIATGVKCLVSDPNDGEMNEQGQSGIVGIEQQWDVWVPTMPLCKACIRRAPPTSCSIHSLHRWCADAYRSRSG